MAAPVLIVGNGPSSLDNIDRLPSDLRAFDVARLNFFFLEQQQSYGARVDFYFWAVNRAQLHDGLRDTVRSGRYEFGRFACPVPVSKMDYGNGRVADDPFFTRDRLFDHWRVLGRNNVLGRLMMSRPLPTLGMQALATFAAMGVEEAHLIGIDLYQSKDRRYAYEVPKELAESLGNQHTSPGYEAGAHSLEADLDFFQALTQEYPRLQIVNHGYCGQLDDILGGKRSAVSLALSPLPLEQSELRASIDLATAMPSGTGLEPNEGWMQVIERRLSECEIRERELSQFANEGVSRQLKLLESSVDLLATEGLPDSEVLWVVHEMSSLAGVYRPLQAYLRTGGQHFGAAPRVLDLSDPVESSSSSVLNYMSARPFKLVINSVACFSDSRVERLIDAASDVAIYLHETEWTMNGYAQKDAEGYQRFLRCVPFATVFCVSPAQARFVTNTYTPRATRVVFNSVDTMLEPSIRELRRASAWARSSGRGETLRVGMVGSFQARKGSELFTAVAREFARASLPVSFEWVGKHHEGRIDREAIHYHGPKSPAEAQEFIERLDVLFIPSRDDPQPLAALEAASRFKKIVCFAGIGTAEWVKTIDGCSVFDEYTTTSAVAALGRALEAELDCDALDAVLRTRFDMVPFTVALRDAIADLKLAEDHPAQGRPNAWLGPRLMQVVDSVVRRVPESPQASLFSLAVDLRNAPGETKRYYELALGLAAAGDRETGDRVILAGIHNNPTKPSAKRHAAEYFAKTDRLARAKALVEQAIEENPESRAALRLQEEIDGRMDSSARSGENRGGPAD